MGWQTHRTFTPHSNYDQLLPTGCRITLQLMLAWEGGNMYLPGGIVGLVSAWEKVNTHQGAL